MLVFGLQQPFVQTILTLEDRGFLQLQNSIKYRLPAILMCTGDYKMQSFLAAIILNSIPTTRFDNITKTMFMFWKGL